MPIFPRRTTPFPECKAMTPLTLRLRSRRAAAAASVGAGEPPSALATGDSPPPAGRPISRRSRSDPQRT
ncbi:Protein of unknown function [Gryllus bimaculatus]|nr:Protein of unknown function [Gryllus bimaculatus]